MLYQVLSIYDSKPRYYCKPFYATTVEEALRSFVDIVNDPTSAYFKHPEDYTIFHLGTFDALTAKYTPLETPVSYGLALQFKKTTQAELESLVNTKYTPGAVAQ